jgi:hypothetical protein
LAIPLRQVEITIRFKKFVDKAPPAIYSSLTIADHCVRGVALANPLIRDAKSIAGGSPMLLADLSEGLSGLKQWSEPVIFDRLIAAYHKLIEDRDLARGLTRLHARVWRALIAGDMAGFEELREALVGSLEPCDLTLDHLAEVDGDIMTELLDVVMARYNRSQRTARAYHLALMELAGRLPPVRLAA